MSYSYSPVEDTERGRKDKACMNIIGSKNKVNFFILLVFLGNVTGVMQAALRVGEVYTIYY